MKYCTLYRVGHWASLDAECETKPPDECGLIGHNVSYHLINQFGDSCRMGFGIFTGNSRGEDVLDEDGETFPSLSVAVAAQAERLMKLARMPGLWTDAPARHETWQGTTAIAFG